MRRWGVAKEGKRSGIKTLGRPEQKKGEVQAGSRDPERIKAEGDRRQKTLARKKKVRAEKKGIRSAVASLKESWV